MPAVVGIYGDGARTGIETNKNNNTYLDLARSVPVKPTPQGRDGQRDDGGGEQWLAGKGRAATAAAGEVVKLSGSSSGRWMMYDGPSIERAMPG